MEKSIVYVALLMIILNVVMFLIVVMQKIKLKSKNVIKSIYAKKINDIVYGDKPVFLPKRMSRFEIKIVREICLEYLKYLKGENRSKIRKLFKLTINEKYYLGILNKGLWFDQAVAAYYLGVAGSKKAIYILEHKLDADNVELQFNVARALIMISGVRYLEDIIIKLGRNGPRMNMIILNFIKDIEDVEINPILRKLAEKAEVENIKAIALMGLCDKNDPSALIYIKEFILNGSEFLKVSALNAAEIFGDFENWVYVTILLSCKNDESWEVRCALAKVLGKIIDMRSISVLKELLNDPNYHVSLAAARSLTRHPDKGLMVLMDAFYGIDTNVRNISLHVLQMHSIHNMYNIYDQGDFE